MTRMRSGLLIVAVALAGPAGAAAQVPDPAGAVESRERMAALDWMVGHWEGDGWIVLPGLGRQEFTSRETVEARLDGRVLIVEGVHAARGTGEVMHHALGALSWNASADAFVFHTWLGNSGGSGADNEFETTGDGFRWRPNSGPAGPRVEYTATHAAGEWVERGRATLPNGQTVDFFEMRLRKVE